MSAIDAKNSDEIKQLINWANTNYLAPSPNFVKKSVILRNIQTDAISIETGTYLGDTTSFLSKHSIYTYSIEPDKVLYDKAINRFTNDKNIKIFNNTSENIFPELLPKLNGRVNFWLDGHYSGDGTFKGPSDTPIVEELEIIFYNLKNYESISILIDDVRLFNGKIHSYGKYPNLDYLVDWSKKCNLSWHIEHDIFILRS